MKRLNFSKRVFSALLSFCLLLSFIACEPLIGYSAETDEIVYNGNEFEAFTRTKEDVAEQYSIAHSAGETYINGDSSTYYKIAPSFEDPYSGGELTEDTHIAMTAEANYMRWLVGVNPLIGMSKHSDQRQAGALIRNWHFSHWPSVDYKPDDMTDEYWKYAYDAPHNILSRYSTPLGSIDNWMNEGYYDPETDTWDTIGHRMAIISSTVSDLQFGYAGTVAIGLEAAFENEIPDQAFFAFPAPGNMPIDIVSTRSSAWTVELNRSIVKNSNPDGVVVKVTNISTGESYECTSENHMVTGISTLQFVQPKVDEGVYMYEDGSSYKVEISGLEDVKTGEKAKIEYTVNFFDVTDYADSFVQSACSAEGFKNIVIGTNNATKENLEKIAAVLSPEIKVTAESGRTALVPAAGEWVLDEENKCWRNSVNKEDLPNWLTDRANVLDDIVVTYDDSDPYYSYSSLDIDPIEPKVGDSGKFYIYRYMLTSNTSLIYQLTQTNGKYSTVKRFDSRVDEYETYGNYDQYHIYTMDSFKKSDSGEYLAIYYHTSFNDDAYATNFVTLEVQGDDPNPDPGPNPDPDPNPDPGPDPDPDPNPNPDPNPAPDPLPEGSLGDVDNDLAITSMDATLVLQRIANIIDEMTPNYYDDRADVDKDGDITPMDATLILQYIAGIITKF